MATDVQAMLKAIKEPKSMGLAAVSLSTGSANIATKQLILLTILSLSLSLSLLSLSLSLSLSLFISLFFISLYISLHLSITTF